MVGEAIEEGSGPLEITITTNEAEKTLTIQDTVSIQRRRCRVPGPPFLPVPVCDSVGSHARDEKVDGSSFGLRDK